MADRKGIVGLFILAKSNAADKTLVIKQYALTTIFTDGVPIGIAEVCLIDFGAYRVGNNRFAGKLPVFFKPLLVG